MMNQKIVKGYLPLGIGIILLLLGLFVFNSESVKVIGGLCFGLGAGLSGMSFSNLVNIEYLNNHPEVRKQAQIESADERNRTINQMAKAKTLDIINWCVIGIAYLTIIIEAPIWVTLVCVAVFLLKYILEWTFVIKFQKTM